MNKTKKNIMYNIIYQILILIIPLITLPYISRRLGTEGVGIYSFSYSIVYYFMMFAMIGFNNYGNRTIAKSRDNIEQLTKNFKEIHSLQTITSIIMIALFNIFVIFNNSEYKFIFFLQSLHVWSCMFDINWFFFGIEEFKITVVRNMIIKVLSLICIFIFVNNANDVWKYTLILSSSILISQLALWPIVKKKIDTKLIFKKDIKKHIIPCLKLFLPVIAVTIFKIMDKTMIGVFSNIVQVGLYENAEKIINVPIALITAIGTVMLPKMSNIYSKKSENEKATEIINNSLKAVMFLSFAMAFGVFCVSRDFSIFFFGEQFKDSGIIIQYLSITIIFLAWGNVIRTQYLIPNEMDREYIISAFLGAFVNLILNIIFIPKYGAIGACIGTIFAEFFVMLYQTLAVRKKIPVIKYLYNVLPFFMKSIIMFLIIYPVCFLRFNSVIKMAMQIILGIVIYMILNMKYILSIINFKKSIGIKNTKE